MSITHKVEAYSLVDFINGIQEGFDLGYRVDQSVNSQVAIGTLGYYRIIMQKGNKQVPALFKPKQEQEVDPRQLELDFNQDINEPAVLAVTEDKPQTFPEVSGKLRDFSEVSVKPFEPSIKFVVETPVKKRGRPKAAPQGI